MYAYILPQKLNFARLQLLGSSPTGLDINEIVSKLALLTL